MAHHPPTDHAPRYVGFWLRFWAFVVDSVVVTAILLPILWMAFGKSYFEINPASRSPVGALIELVLPAAAVVLFWIYRSATPGKMIIHARIVDAQTGEPPGKLQCVIRYLGYYVSIFSLGIGFLWIAFDPRKQGWHDKIARTLVISDSPRA